MSSPPPSEDIKSDTTEAWLAASPMAAPFVAPVDLPSWHSRKQWIRSELWQLLGNLPPRPKNPSVKILSRTKFDGYSVEKFQFDNGAGSTVPGYFLLPERRSGKVPAILYHHWHGDQYPIGKEELFGTNALPLPPGPALAKQGYAVLAIDACCFGERNGKGPGGPVDTGASGEMTASKFNFWLGRSLWGMIVRDDLMALDYLCTRPEVDAERIGVTGISMGSTRTWWLMALDERPRCGVAVACLTRYEDLIRSQGLKHHGIYYYVPGILSRFDTESVVALIAPRPILFQSGEEDAGSPAQGVLAVEKAVRPIYELFQSSEAFQSILYPGVGHAYTPKMWQSTLGWLEKHLRRPA